MNKIIEVKVAVETLQEEQNLDQIIRSRLDYSSSQELNYRINRKSVDARKPTIYLNYQIEILEDSESSATNFKHQFEYQNVENKSEIHIIGSGPAGLFAALRAIELGFKPIIFERGKDVQARRRDLKAINQDHIVNPDSNYCFGEGGAGTYSDGKLYTRSTKRGDIRRIFEILVHQGADPTILVDAHPHIGTNKLPKIIASIREKIKQCGGEIHFESRVTDFILEKNSLVGLEINNKESISTSKVIVATGHSARDIFELLHAKNVLLEAKSLAMGVRVEHPQTLIDSIQYHCKGDRHSLLPAAPYSIVNQINERGVYSFCMCPGGFVVPAATGANEVVVNGMSPSKRNNIFANSGIVVEIDIEKDLKKYDHHGPMKALRFQQDLELLAFNAGGKSQSAPAQRLTDFVNGIPSNSVNASSYQPGLRESPLHSILPKNIGSRLRKGFKGFGQKMKGFVTEEANIIGVESRTSSPIKIPRDNTSLEHPQIKGLFPCGEGAGYAGGIISAAVDGERVVQAISVLDA